MNGAQFENEKVDRIDRPRDFEIIALEHDDYLERMKALDFIEDFEALEQIYVGDEYFTVRMKARDRLIELFTNTNLEKKLQKCLELSYKIFKFWGWTPFPIAYLRMNNNIDGGIRWVLYQNYGYHRREKMGEFIRGKMISDIVNVAIKPLLDKGGRHETTWRMHDEAYHYELVVKVLQENEEKELYHDYLYCRAWNTLKDAHDVYHFEKCFK